MGKGGGSGYGPPEGWTPQAENWSIEFQITPGGKGGQDTRFGMDALPPPAPPSGGFGPPGGFGGPPLPRPGPVPLALPSPGMAPMGPRGPQGPLALPPPDFVTNIIPPPAPAPLNLGPGLRPPGGGGGSLLPPGMGGAGPSNRENWHLPAPRPPGPGGMGMTHSASQPSYSGMQQDSREVEDLRRQVKELMRKNQELLEDANKKGRKDSAEAKKVSDELATALERLRHRVSCMDAKMAQSGHRRSTVRRTTMRRASSAESLFFTAGLLDQADEPLEMDLHGARGGGGAGGARGGGKRGDGRSAHFDPAAMAGKRDSGDQDAFVFDLTDCRGTFRAPGD